MGLIDAALRKIFPLDDMHQVEPYKTASGRQLISIDPPTDGGRSDWWEIFPERWHEVFPYQFVIKQTTPGGFITQADTVGEDLAIYTLPIPPQAMSMRMVPASQITPTLGGVVEETSANVFWDISLNGTTGTAVGKKGDLASQMNGSASSSNPVEHWYDSAVNLFVGQAPKVATKFREVIKTTGEMSGIFGALQNAAGRALGTLDQIDKLTQPGSVAGAAGAAAGAIQSELLPSPMFTSSAVSRLRNGFGEIQQMERFFLVYSRLRGAFPKEFYLKFRMYKTNQEWTCAVKDFQILQSSQQPHLYKYSIQLRCWQVGSVGNADSTNAMAYDRFGSGGDLAAVNILSLKQTSAGLKALFKRPK